MLTNFSQITPHLKFKSKVISIDNLGFKFHYRGTFILLLVCTVLVTSRQYIGEHIRCMTGGAPTIPEHVINTFCFFTTTFTVVRHLNETMLQHESLPHPGIGPVMPDDEIRHHAYYQWVPFVLFAQAITFYLPHLFWRSWEGGKIKTLVIGLQAVLLSNYLAKEEDLQINKSYVIYSKPTIEKKLRVIKTAFMNHIRVNRNWAGKMVFCEFLNLVNLLLQIYLTHLFLGRQFLTLGIDFIRDDFQGMLDTLDIVFPKVTKCHFYKYGASGSIQKHDALCEFVSVMALNVINEKIFVFLWFWYCILLVVSVLSLLWRLMTVCLHSRSTWFNGFVFSFACPGKMNPWDMLVVTNEFFFSDWLFLYYLARNMKPYLFRQMLLDHIIPEIQSEKNSVNLSPGADSTDEDSENEKLKESEAEDENLDDHSLNSEDMAIVPSSSLVAVNEKRTQNITMETNKKSDSTKSRFVDAQVALMSNPFHHEPIGEVESMEDLLAINNPYERRDMLQSSENKKKQQQISNGLKDYFKLQEIQTDNAVFRLHNVFTTVLLLTCSLVITATQYVGNPISCIVSGIPTHVVNTFCWISSTFTMPDAYRRQVGLEVAHPGVSNDFNDEDAKKYHTYYQWVCFVLFFQACACYTPKFLWDAFEGGLLRTIAMNLNLGICREEEKCAKKQLLIDYMLKHLKRHKMYAIRYWICEALCMVNIVVQMILMNKFFDGEFADYGWRVLKYSDTPQDMRVDPMVYVFPRVTKCIFHKYALCILPLNIVNEKTYIFIWFWYIILLAMLVGLFIYRLLIIFVPAVRARVLNARNRMVPRETAVSVSNKVDIGDWWIIYMLGRNLDPIIYKDVLLELSKSIEKNPSKKNLN
ncbi:CLUMA_CG005716, isoform A [Clunio marinus]|uniref:Innexin n=1 Tax=Clunio marinus TaxID=568069 RepID=A0A1J1HXG5_9DIPT|nr:CLUMA_CG005716, isoform A [Clunio marinus]